MGRGRLGSAVDFGQQEARGIVELLQDVEGGDAGFLEAVAGVFEGGGAEGLDGFRSDVDMDLDDEHGDVDGM